MRTRLPVAASVSESSAGMALGDVNLVNTRHAADDLFRRPAPGAITRGNAGGWPQFRQPGA